jgi:Meiotically Up-regulated Gene 113 (MUG113) protein
MTVLDQDANARRKIEWDFYTEALRGRRRATGENVPALCDWPNCEEVIDRGWDYACHHTLDVVYMANPGPTLAGCGLFFCHNHSTDNGLCHKCEAGDIACSPRLDRPEWREYLMRYFDDWVSNSAHTVIADMRCQAGDPEPESVAVYVAEPSTGERIVKIGISADPYVKMKQLASHATLLRWLPNRSAARQEERMWHRVVAAWHVSGRGREWFHLTNGLIRLIWKVRWTVNNKEVPIE